MKGNGDKKKRIWQCATVLLGMAFVVAAILAFVPPLQTFIIHTAETRLVHRTLQAWFWNKWLFKAGLAVMAVAAATAAFVYVLCFAYHPAPNADGVRLVMFPVARFKKDWKVFAAVFLTLLAVRVYYLGKKQGLHVDDGLSVIGASYGEYGFRMKDGSVKSIVHRGGALNLLIFAFEVVFAYMLLTLLFRGNFVVFCTLAAMFLTTAYASVILFAIAGLALVIISIRRNRYDTALFLYLIAFLTFVFAVCLYPHYFRGFFVNRSAQTWKHLQNTSLDGFVIKSAAFVASQCQKNLFYLPIVILSIAAVFLSRFFAASDTDAIWETSNGRPRIVACAFTIIAAVLWIAVIAVIMPFNDVRHLYAAFPLCSLLLALAASWGSVVLRRVYLSLVVVLYALALPLQNVLPSSSYKPQVDYLYTAERQNYKCLKDPNIPIVIAHYDKDAAWKSAMFIPFFNDNQEVHISRVQDGENGTDFVARQPYDDFFLLTTMLEAEADRPNAPFDLSAFHIPQRAVLV